MDNEEIDFKIIEALNLIKNLINEYINVGHYIQMPESILQLEDRVTLKYIDRRFDTILRLCPYKVKFVEFDNELLNGRTSFNKIIKIRECLSSQEHFRVLIHEWCHNILHMRSNAVEKNLFEKELEAESTSFIVCYVLGAISSLSHSYIYYNLEDVTLNKEEQLKIFNETFDKSEKRIIKTAHKILEKLSFMQNQIEYHRKSNGEKL